MPKVLRGALTGRALKVGIVRARFNEEITAPLLSGALRALIGAGVEDDDIVVAEVPGAVEIPLAVQELARRRPFDAIVALGAVIRGETPHFDYVCRTANDGCLSVSLELRVPVAFGILTVEDEDQALARCRDDDTNKGYEAALAAVEMARLLRSMS